MSAYKTFPGWTREFVRNGISYVNLMYLLKTIPPYRGTDDKDNNKETGGNSSKKYTHFEQFNF